jgi:hypothetical protein
MLLTCENNIFEIAEIIFVCLFYASFGDDSICLGDCASVRLVE